MSPRRVLGIIVVALATSLSLVSPALASPYGPHTGAATVSRTQVVQGSTVRLSGDDFCPGAAVHVTVTLRGDTYISRTIHANGSGVAATTLRLTRLGLNHLKLTGCYAITGANNGTQTLSAAVNVVPHHGRLHASDHKVNKGDTITVSGGGFCKNATIKVRVYDDGHRYQAKTITANRHGRASTSIKLTRKGTTTITFQGCRKGGGEVLKSVTVKVRGGHSFLGAPAAYVGGLARDIAPPAVGLSAGALLVLLGSTIVMFARRRRSSAALIEPNG